MPGISDFNNDSWQSKVKVISVNSKYELQLGSYHPKAQYLRPILRTLSFRLRSFLSPVSTFFLSLSHTLQNGESVILTHCNHFCYLGHCSGEEAKKKKKRQHFEDHKRLDSVHLQLHLLSLFWFGFTTRFRLSNIFVKRFRFFTLPSFSRLFLC